MTCDRIRPLLSNYHDDALSPRERARVRDHVVACASCRAALEGYDRLYATLRQAPVAVPADLRRNVYAGIARLDGGPRGALLPFGPNMWGMLRAAGGTAGLLAVLGGLVFAAMHAASGPAPAMPPTASVKGIAAAETAAAGVVVAMGVAPARRLPMEMRTAIASMHSDLAGAEPLSMTVGKGTLNHGGVDVPVSFVRKSASGAPRAVSRGHFVVALHSSTPVVSGVSVSNPSPAPTIASGEGLAYLHLRNPNALTGHGNSPADVAFHPFVSSARRAILATPVADQLFTGLTVGADGHTIAYSARGQGDLGGVFGVDLNTLRHAPLFSLRDPSPPDAPYGHVFVKQVYATRGGPLLLTVVNQDSPTGTVTINITGSRGLTMTGVMTAPLQGQWGYWYDYVVAPDRHAVAWTERPTYPDGIGLLKLVSLDAAHPATLTIGAGGHPVWSPDGTKILYERDKPAGLYVWSAATGARRVAPFASIARPSLDEFAWAPNSRYFAYVTSTASTSMVRLGDADAPGYTWPVFADNWIGAIAWAHAPATTASAPAASPTPTATASAAGASPALSMTAGISMRMPASAPVRPHPLFDNTDTPANVLHSFYNAIDRREYRRAFAYLYNLPGDTPNYDTFKNGYATTLEDTVSLTPASYRIGANVNATTCVGFDLTARQANGTVRRFGGWYVVRSTSGRKPAYGGWRIIMSASRGKEGARGVVPPQARCTVRSHASS